MFHIKALLAVVVLSFSTVAFSGDTEKKHEQMVYPVVLVSYGTSGGSGTVIYSEDRSSKDEYESFVLTNHHVISEAIQVVNEWSSMYGREVKQERRATVKVEIFHYEDLSKVVGRESFDSDIVAYSPDHDLALLKIRTKRKVDFVAKLRTKDAAGKSHLFDPVTVVGCSLLHPPLITTGEITSMNDEIDGKSFWMSSAQIIFGNSGGAVFIQEGEEWCFSGVPSRIAVANWSTPVTHMGYFIPMTRVYKWLEFEHLDFIYDATKTPKECFDFREQMSKKELPKP